MRDSTLKRLLRLVLAAHLFFPLTWLFSQVSAGTPDRRDWFYLRLAGERFLDGRLSAIHTTVDEGFLWRYPPYALLLAAALAMVDPGGAYWLVVSLSIIAVAVTLLLLRHLLRPHDFDLIHLGRWDRRRSPRSS